LTQGVGIFRCSIADLDTTSRKAVGSGRRKFEMSPGALDGFKAGFRNLCPDDDFPVKRTDLKALRRPHPRDGVSRQYQPAAD
jgi:hypothetical protein